LDLIGSGEIVMSPIKACVALITLLAASTFANSQEVATGGPPAATPGAEEAAVAATPEEGSVAEAPVAEEASVAATPEEAPVAASSDDAVIAAADAAAAVKVVNAAELIAREPPRVICREMLKQGSNVHVLQCLTAENWKIWDRAEARDAASIVRMLQGNPYR
jgi:hypothetical protein